MPRRIKVDTLESMCIDNIYKNMYSYWYEKYWKPSYSSRKRLLSEFGPFEYLPVCLVNKITEKLSYNPRFGIDVMSSLITSYLVKLELPEYFELERKTFDLISLRCQDTLKELTLSGYSGDKEVLKNVIKSLRKIEVLNLDFSYIDDGVLAVVGSHCSELRKLTVKYCSGITDISMKYLFVNESTEDGLNSYGKCKLIESLNLVETEIGEIGVETVLRNAPRLQNLDHRDVCLVLRKMHGNVFESDSPLVQYSLTTLHAEDYYRSFGSEKSLAKSLPVATRVCPQLTDVCLTIRSENKSRDVLRPLCQLKNIKNLDLEFSLERHEDLFSDVISVLSVSGKSITRLHLKGFLSADVGIIGICCPLLEDIRLYIYGGLRMVPSGEETFISPANNKRPFAFLKFLYLFMTMDDCGMRVDTDIRPSEWKDLLSSRLLESLDINRSFSLTDNLLSDVLKDGQEFPNLRKIELFGCPNITTGFVRSFLDLSNPLEAIKVMQCQNIPESDYVSLKSFCKVNCLDVDIHVSSD